MNPSPPNGRQPHDDLHTPSSQPPIGKTANPSSGAQKPYGALKVGARHELAIRVSYAETDGQRRVHHANYLNYFERGRVELLRAAGFSYREFEDAGRLLVVTEMNVRYLGAAQFDDLLLLETTVTGVRNVRVNHHYVLRREGEVLVEADSTIACLDQGGRPARIPKEWRD